MRMRTTRNRHCWDIWAQRRSQQLLAQVSFRRNRKLKIDPPEFDCEPDKKGVVLIALCCLCSVYPTVPCCFGQVVRKLRNSGEEVWLV